MKTISFFSFKGGVGRTNLMLNVAYELASRGHFVVMADWDLHAPGLTIMDDLRRPKGLSLPEDMPDLRPGVLDYLKSVLSPDETIPSPASLAQPTRMGKDARGSGEFEGDLWLIPAGSFAADNEVQSYHKQLREVQQYNLAGMLTDTDPESDSNPRRLLVHFSESIAQLKHPELDRTPDYLLIDSRTGITELGDLLLTDFIDHMVLLSGLNEQNLNGLSATTQQIQKQLCFGELRSRLSLIFGPVPQGEEQLKQRRLEVVDQLIKDLARENNDTEKERMPDPHFMPYHPHIALSETPMIQAYPNSEPAKITKAVTDELERKSLYASTEAASEQIRANLNKTLEPDKKKSYQPVFPISPFADMPRWNWPNPEVSIERFNPAFTADDLAVLNGLARSLSYKKDEKRKIIETYSELTSSNKQELLNVFIEERNKFEDIAAEHSLEVSQALLRSFAEWLQLWEELELIDAISCLREIVNGGKVNYLGNWPQLSLFWFFLTDDLKERELWNEIEQAYHKSIELDRKWSNPWNNLGNVLNDHLRRHKEAEQAYRKAIELDDKSAHPWLGLGNVNYHLKRDKEAEQAYRRAIELDGKYAAPWNGLGNLLSDHLQRYEEAEKAYRKAIELDEKKAAPWNGLGNLLSAHLQRYEEAEQAYCKVIELDDKLAVPWNGLGNVLGNHLQRYEKAEQAYRKAIELDDKYASPWNGLGYLLNDHLQRYKEAEQAYRKAIELDDKNAMPWNGLGSLYLQQSDLIQAHECLKNATTLEPNEPNYSITLAEIALVAKNENEAENQLRVAKNLLKSVKNKLHHSMIALALSLYKRDTAAIENILNELQTLRLESPELPSAWSFKDQESFIQTLPKIEQALYRAWIKRVKTIPDNPQLTAKALANWRKSVKKDSAI